MALFSVLPRGAIFERWPSLRARSIMICLAMRSPDVDGGGISGPSSRTFPGCLDPTKLPVLLAELFRSFPPLFFRPNFKGAPGVGAEAY